MSGGLTKSPIEEVDMDEPYNLQRFVEAQNSCFDNVLSELRSGNKKSHWMWFIFPQIEGLGYSPLAHKFAISSQAEAEAYLRHTILGPRLRECTRLVNLLEGRPLEQIFGNPDDLKFRSCMTLFAHTTQDNQVFIDALQKYCEGKFDSRTLDRLQSTSSDIAP
jgi:uncharacterized protein (DUF1810 family)